MVSHQDRKSLLDQHEETYLRERCRKAIVSYPPRWLTVGITNICNNRCVFCAYHCDDAKGASHVYNIPFRLSFDDFKRIVDLAYEGLVPRIHICGTGEPFMNRDVIPMMDYCIGVYGSTSIQTNFCKPLFDKFDYLGKILERQHNISFITTDILSGDPRQHNELKRGSSYEDVMHAIAYISQKSDIPVRIHFIVTLHNFMTIPQLLSDIMRRGIHCNLNIVNLFSYEFNAFCTEDAVYRSNHNQVTDVLNRAVESGKQAGIPVSIPPPADKESSGCTVFWDKIQTWPVNGNDPRRLHENLVPHACSAVVKGELDSLGYIFDYQNIMELWNNERIVSIRQSLIDGRYPDKKCSHCYCYRADKDEIARTRANWESSMQKHLEEFRQSNIIKNLTNDSICIDCGANVGEITAIMAEKGAKIYAFEPNPAAYSRLTERFENNDKIVCCPKAVSDRSGMARLYLYKYAEDDQIFWSQGASICIDKDDIDEDKYVEVELVNLIDFIQKMDKPIDILKLDVEGVEFDLLAGIIEHGIYKKIGHILVETHERHIKKLTAAGDEIRRRIKEMDIRNINLDWI